MRRIAAVLALGLLAALALVAITNHPPPLDLTAVPQPDVDPIAAMLAREAEVAARSGITPGAGKRLRWLNGEAGRQTPLAVVYLHGFSATRQEIAPVNDLLADALGANLFETRLTGHGRERDRLEDVVAEDWLADAHEAVRIGRLMGERIVLVGTSTGATLALALQQAGALEDVVALVLVSPNFGPRDRNSDFLTWPGGPVIGRLLAGERHSWTPANALQARYWSTDYPLAAVVEMMRLVNALRLSLPMKLEQPVLVLLSPRDSVIDVARARDALAQIDAPALEIVEVDAGGPSNHVLAGDILAPANNARLTRLVQAFLLRELADNPG